MCQLAWGTASLPLQEVWGAEARCLLLGLLWGALGLWEETNEDSWALSPGPSPPEGLPCPNRAVLYTSSTPRKPSMRHTTSPSFLSQPSSHTVPQRRSWYTSTRPSCGPEPFTSRIITASTLPAGSSPQSLLCSGHSWGRPGTCPAFPLTPRCTPPTGQRGLRPRPEQTRLGLP